MTDDGARVAGRIGHSPLDWRPSSPTSPRPLPALPLRRKTGVANLRTAELVQPEQRRLRASGGQVAASPLPVRGRRPAIGAQVGAPAAVVPAVGCEAPLPTIRAKSPVKGTPPPRPAPPPAGLGLTFGERLAAATQKGRRARQTFLADQVRLKRKTEGYEPPKLPAAPRYPLRRPFVPSEHDTLSSSSVRQQAFGSSPLGHLGHTFPERSLALVARPHSEALAIAKRLDLRLRTCASPNMPREAPDYAANRYRIIVSLKQCLMDGVIKPLVKLEHSTYSRPDAWRLSHHRALDISLSSNLAKVAARLIALQVVVTEVGRFGFDGEKLDNLTTADRKRLLSMATLEIDPDDVNTFEHAHHYAFQAFMLSLAPFSALVQASKLSQGAHFASTSAFLHLVDDRVPSDGEAVVRGHLKSLCIDLQAALGAVGRLVNPSNHLSWRITGYLLAAIDAGSKSIQRLIEPPATHAMAPHYAPTTSKLAFFEVLMELCYMSALLATNDFIAGHPHDSTRVAADTAWAAQNGMRGPRPGPTDAIAADRDMIEPHCPALADLHPLLDAMIKKVYTHLLKQRRPHSRASSMSSFA